MTTIWGTRMSRSWRLRAYGAFAVLAAGVIAASSSGNAAAAGSKPSGGTLNEAVITAFTGPESFIGGVLSAGAYPAVYEINQAGGVMGKDFSVSTVDTRGDPADALPLVQRFLGTATNLVGICRPGRSDRQPVAPGVQSAQANDDLRRGIVELRSHTPTVLLAAGLPGPGERPGHGDWARRRAISGSRSCSEPTPPRRRSAGHPVRRQASSFDVVANLSLTPDQPSYQSGCGTLLAAHPQAIFTEEDTPRPVLFSATSRNWGRFPRSSATRERSRTVGYGAVAAAMGASTFAGDYTGLTPAPAKTHPHTRPG